MVSANTTVRMVAGFADRVLNAGITADANNYNNEAFFRKIAGGTTWTAVTRSAAGAETVTPLTNLVTTMSILRIEIDNSGAGAVRFYIDGTLVATHTGASIPAAATRLGYHVGIHNTAAAAKILYVDYLRVWSDDPPMSGTTIESFLASSPILASGSIANTYSSKGFLQEVDALLDTTSSRTLSGDIIFTEKGEYSTEEYAEHVLNFTKKSLEKMSGTKIVSDLAFRTLSADKICIAGTCYTSGALVTHDSLQAILGTQTQSTTYSTTIIESSDDTGILDSFIKTLEKLFVQIETVFNEIVTFVKSVTFQSDVTFEERVIFEDHDMAGTAIILAGDSSVRVDFARPYATIPVVTVSADAFVTYRVTDKGVTGFTIETQNNVSSDTRFDWIALMVTGSSVTSSASSSGELVPVEPIPTEVTPEEVTEEVPEEVIPPVVSEVTEESAPEVTPEESVTEEVTENVPTEEVIDEVTTETTTDVATLDIPVEDSITVEDTPTEITPEAPVEVPTVSGE